MASGAGDVQPLPGPQLDDGTPHPSPETLVSGNDGSNRHYHSRLLLKAQWIQEVLQLTLGQFQFPLCWMVTPQLEPLPLGLATRT